MAIISFNKAFCLYFGFGQNDLNFVCKKFSINNVSTFICSNVITAIAYNICTNK